MTQQIEHLVTLQSNELRNRSFSEIETTARLLLPLNSSASNLARALSSSLNRTELSFQAIQTKIAPTLLLALSTIPNLSQVSYIGLDGLMFSFYNDEDQTLAVFSNASFSSTWFTQPVNPGTGTLYGEANSSKSLLKSNSRLFQRALNRKTAYSSVETGWNKAQDLLFLNSVAIDGIGVISIGFPAKVVSDHFAGIDFHGGTLYLATSDGQVLVETKIPDTKIVVNNGTVSLHLLKQNGVIEDHNHLCNSSAGETNRFDSEIGGMNHIFYCSTLEIAGVQSVYLLAFPTKGLESLGQENSKLALTLLVLMFVIVVTSLCIFITLILRAARREMFLCATLIKQMEATQQAERKSMNKSLAFDRASHDVRGSLGAITQSIDICREQTTPNSVTDTKLQQMQTCAEDLLGVLNSVLDTSKIEAGKIQLQEVEFNMAQFLEDVVDLYYPIGMKKGVDVMLDPCDGSIFKLNLVRGDTIRLKQILYNLISNAVKFTSKGHVSVRAMVKKPSRENAIIASNQSGVLNCLSRLFLRSNGSFGDLDRVQMVRDNPNHVEFVLEVDDTGKGIPKEHQKSVFENFVQVKEQKGSGLGLGDRAALGQEGCGLGLGIVQSLVRLMGGEIKIVDKDPGERGTCFSFNIFLTTSHSLSTDNEKPEDNLTLNSEISLTDSHQHFGLHRRSPSPRSEGSHIVLLIAGEERRKVSKKVIENLGLKVSVAKQAKDLFHILKKAKHRLDLSQYSSSEKSELCTNEYLSKSESGNSNSRGSNSKSSTSFILIVIDSSAGNFYELCSIVGNFKKDIPNPRCKVVWLENPVMLSRGHEEHGSAPPWDHILSKPFHGSRLYRVLGLLPEFGGMFQCNSHRFRIETDPKVENTRNEIGEHSLKQIVMETDGEKRSERPLNGKKVLVVDNLKLLRMVVAAEIRKLGANVDVCENGKEAFDRVCKVLGDQRREEGDSQALPYDYIFMDCEMPIMNGYEATKLIRKEEKHYGIHIPIIALTAHSMDEEASNTIIHAGMDFHLTKPLQVDKLLDVIQSIDKYVQH
ncbi:unnamed protein product [Camellia sinensis]